MVDNMKALCQYASLVALDNKVLKAITNQRDEIYDMLQQLIGKTQMRQGGLSLSKKSQEIMQIIQSVLEMTSNCKPFKNGGSSGKSTCKCCSKLLEVKDVKQCAKCKQVVYCSKKCQEIDWKQSHKRECKFLGVSHLRSTFEGTDEKNMVKVEQQTQNVADASFGIFSNNVPNILMQAILQNCDITNGVVIIHHGDSPPSIQFVTLENFQSTITMDSSDTEQIQHQKMIIEKCMSEGSLPLLTIYPIRNSSVLKSTAHLGSTPSTPPIGVLVTGLPPPEDALFPDWSAHQAAMKRDLPCTVDSIKENPNVRMAIFGPVFCTWYDNVFSNKQQEKEVKDPSVMTIKELKAAIADAGLGQEAAGFVEKSEFVELLQRQLNLN